MDNLELKIFAIGELYDNCYVVYNKETKNAFIIDAPYPIKVVRDFIKEEKLNVLFLVLTHGHFDHIGGLEGVSFPFGINKEDVPLLTSSIANGSIFFNSAITVTRAPSFFLTEDKPLDFDSLKVEILHTPGHTPGSVCIKLGKWLFSGDTIFFDSIGRTDIALASYESLIKSIKEKILVLPHDIIIYPGHGHETTVGREVKENPFLNNK